jgi:hypothetical protein
VAEDQGMLDLVAAMENGFTGVGLVRHTFMPGGFGNDTASRGLQLTDDLDTVVGYTDTLLLRHNVLEDTLNNFIADGILAVADSVADVTSVPGRENGVDISMANGFRFGNAVLPLRTGCNSCGVITLLDLYTWFPIAPAVNIADFSGQSIQNSLNTNLVGAGQDRLITVDSKNPGNVEADPAEQIGQPDNTPDTTLVQPTFGAGPRFFSGHVH